MWVKAKLLISLLGLLYIQAKRNFVQQISELESAEWDGPVLHEVFYRNIIELPCAASNRVQQKVNQLLRNSKRHQFHIRWVHNRWDNVVDPWGGDGRRVYMEYNLESIPQHMLQEDYTISSVVTGGMLSIAEVKPTDNGVYACLVTFSDQNWRHVNLDASIVISAHILRVKYPHVEGKMGHILDPMYAWTWNFYHEADAASREFSCSFSFT
ncbi:unnamed protein product [Protopolystoma xenopodis]|uniref:Ig-like domain-containing protein n=1 Tax=Protopolystoma xenopodis TaxID=117903 RepID=A0A3S5BKF8_9PLAT|nr:unnamed protein product [Protopolystoma xenopodis]